jgi:hypothetical protein
MFVSCENGLFVAVQIQQGMGATFAFNTENFAHEQDAESVPPLGCADACPSPLFDPRPEYNFERPGRPMLAMQL